MKKLCMFVACLCGGSLFAATIGSVEFELPPSANEWVLFSRYDSEEDDSNDEDYPQSNENCDEDCDEGHFSCDTYTRTVGDNFELFNAVWFDDNKISDEDNTQDEEFLSSFITQELASLFPNYQFVMKTINKGSEHWFIEWGVHDGIQNIVHGMTRYLQVNGKGGGVLSYATKGLLSDESKIFWMDVLSRAKSLI